MDAEKLGADHTDALMAKMNLATLLKNQGKTAEAEALYQEVIAGYTEKLGADHTDTLRAKGNLAILLHDQEAEAEAEAEAEEEDDIGRASFDFPEDFHTGNYRCRCPLISIN